MSEPLTRRHVQSRRAKIRRPKPDEAKLRELILHISHRSEGDPNFGKVKLYKLLFYADFLSYLRHGKPITGFQYQALDRGPAPIKVQEVMDKMQANNQIAIRIVDYFDKKQHRTLALRLPNLKKFGKAERAIIDELIAKCWGKTAIKMSDISHTFLGWHLAKKREPIPYNVALIGDRAPSIEEREYGRSLEELAQTCLARHAI